jgi:hypothetical protein
MNCEDFGFIGRRQIAPYLPTQRKKPQGTTNGIFYAPIAWLGLCSFYLLLLALDEYAVPKWGANIPSTVVTNGRRNPS